MNSIEGEVREAIESVLRPHAVNGANSGYKICACEGCKYIREQMPKAIAAILKFTNLKPLNVDEVEKIIEKTSSFAPINVLAETICSHFSKPEIIDHLPQEKVSLCYGCSRTCIGIGIVAICAIHEPTKEVQEKEPYQKPKSNHLEVNYIAVGYYKHEIDFGVLGSVQELSDTDFEKMLDMLQTAIRVAKEMRTKKQPTKEVQEKDCDEPKEKSMDTKGGVQPKRSMPSQSYNVCQYLCCKISTNGEKFCSLHEIEKQPTKEGGNMIRPSNADMGELSDVVREYIQDLEQAIDALPPKYGEKFCSEHEPPKKHLIYEGY